MKVLVIGCGPAGLMAAHAVKEAGQDVEIVSRKAKSFIGGAQYLHQPIPGVNNLTPDGYINLEFIGTEEGYAQKVYGDPKAPTSWKKYQDAGVIAAWDLRKTYDKLWDMYYSTIYDMYVTPHSLHRYIDADYDLIISSIPRHAICIRPHHTFEVAKVQIDMKPFRLDENFITWNGHIDHMWYRASSIFGVVGGFEFPWGVDVEDYHDLHPVRKPLSTTCDCWPDIKKVGRYGVWNKELLTHHAFEATMEAMRVMY